MDIVLKLGMGIGWEHPAMQVGEVLIGTVVAIDSVAQTVDLEFYDGSARGKIPWSQLGPQRPLGTAAGVDIIGPRGIASGEKIGEF